VPNWDENSPRSRANFAKILKIIELAARRREKPTLEAAKRWHETIMSGLTVPNPLFVASFRGEPGLEYIQVQVGPRLGLDSRHVAAELVEFEKHIQALVDQLDAALPAGHQPDRDQLAAILDVCAWAHSEWIRIHPFANGNARTARIWADCIAVRYGLPPFVRFRPRPGIGYVEASIKAMRGDWQSTAVVFRRLLDDFMKHY
jgi:hypothetical protein